MYCISLTHPVSEGEIFLHISVTRSFADHISAVIITPPFSALIANIRVYQVAFLEGERAKGIAQLIFSS